MANEELYYNGPVGNLYIRPITCKVVATFTNSGATVTNSTTRRQSHPGTTITGDTGSYAVAGLPTGSDYQVVGCNLLPPTGTQLTCDANVLTFDATAGTLTFKTRRTDTGAEADPADNTILHLTLEIETGAPS